MQRWNSFAFIVLVLLMGANAMATTIPPEVKEIVTFIFVQNSEGNLEPKGTGFFVGVKDEKNPERMYVYLATAKHVIQDETRSYYSSIFIRLNKRAGGAQMIEIPLKGKDAAPVYVHKDPEVDLVVFPILPDQQIYDFKVLPDDMLTTVESFKEANIREGDEVFFTGLFGHFFGAQRNYPIVRFGRVALITDEKIPWQEDANTGVMLDLYLLEVQSFGGNSGSPVFFYLGGTRDPGSLILGHRLLLAGVMKGTFLDAKEVKIAEKIVEVEKREKRKIPVSQENIGIAAVVPSYKLHQILFSDKLREIRAKNR